MPYFQNLIDYPQSTKDATKFYEAKVEELGANLKDLEAIVQGKSNNLRIVEDGMSRSRIAQHELGKRPFLMFCVQYCGKKSLVQEHLDLHLHRNKKSKELKYKAIQIAMKGGPAIGAEGAHEGGARKT